MTHKIAIILHDQLKPWQACNISAFLGSGIPTSCKGDLYYDQNQVSYLPLVTSPILIYEANTTKINRTLTRCLSRQVDKGLFTFDMFETFNDQDNRETVASKLTSDLQLAGIIVLGNQNDVSKIIRGLHFYGTEKKSFLC